MSWKETDPLALWRGATTLPIRPPEDELAKFRALEGYRFIGPRSKTLQSLSEVPASLRAQYLNNMFDLWPYWHERWAFKLPQVTLTAANLLSATYIATKINADIFLANPHVGVWDALRLPKTNLPVIATVLGCGVFASSSLFWHFVRRRIVEDEHSLDAWWMYRRVASIYLLTGVLMPVICTSYLSYFAYMRMQARHVDPNVRNWIDFFTLPAEFSRSIWRNLPRLAAFYLAFGGLCTAVMLWGRNRIHYNNDIRAELIQQIISDAIEKADEQPFNSLSGLARRTQRYYERFIAAVGISADQTKANHPSLIFPSTPISGDVNMPGIYKKGDVREGLIEWIYKKSKQ